MMTKVDKDVAFGQCHGEQYENTLIQYGSVANCLALVVEVHSTD